MATVDTIRRPAFFAFRIFKSDRTTKKKPDALPMTRRCDACGDPDQRQGGCLSCDPW